MSPDYAGAIIVRMRGIRHTLLSLPAELHVKQRPLFYLPELQDAKCRFVYALQHQYHKFHWK